MADQVLIKPREIRQRIDKLEEKLQAIKWDISVPLKSKESIVNLSKGILGNKFKKGVRYQRQIRKEWSRRMKKMGL